MVKYRIVGKLKGRDYKSRFFASEKAALRAGYKKAYMKDGNTKRKGSISSWTVVEEIR